MSHITTESDCPWQLAAPLIHAIKTIQKAPIGKPGQPVNVHQLGQLGIYPLQFTGYGDQLCRIDAIRESAFIFAARILWSTGLAR